MKNREPAALEALFRREGDAAPPTLEATVALAALAHAGQRDKAGEVYLLHPLRLMLRLASEEARLVALLHDVVEDTGVTLDDLARFGYSEAVVAAVDCLTRREAEGETYEAFLERLKPNPLARAVKIADLEDNLDLERIPAPRESDYRRRERYTRALAYLNAPEGG